MMNNPAIYHPGNPYAYGNPQQNPQFITSAPPTSFPQPSFVPTAFPDQFQRPQPPNHQFQQPPQHFHQQQQNFQRPTSTGPHNIQQGFPQHSVPTPLAPTTPQPSAPPVNASNPSAPATSSSAPNNAMTPQSQSVNLAQQAAMQNAAQVARAVPQQPQPMSPQSLAREKARVSVLLDINTVLLQEVVSLQGKGMAGMVPNQNQQSPSSPTSNADPNSAISNSPVDASKQGKPASQEYADCMRRLQANLSYLATIADAKKKGSAPLPVGPAIMIPPPHLTEVHDLYRRLNQLFPEASSSTLNKAMAFASQQANKQNSPVPAHG